MAKILLSVYHLLQAHPDAQGDCDVDGDLPLRDLESEPAVLSLPGKPFVENVSQLLLDRCTRGYGYITLHGSLHIHARPLIKSLSSRLTENTVPNTWYDWSSSSGKKFWSGLLVFVLVFLIIIPVATGNGIFWSNRISSLGQPNTTVSGVCAYSSGGPGSGCYNTPVVLKAALGDTYGTTAFGSSWFCRVLSGGTTPSGVLGPGAGSPPGTIMPGDSSITSSSGACTTNSAYSPGQTVQIEVSSGSGFTYTTTSDIYYTPIFAVPFCTSSTGCQTSSTSVPISVSFTLNPGKNVGANANVISATFPNGTTVTTTETAPCKTGAGATATLGQQFTLSFNVQVAISGTLPSKPYGIGYSSFAPSDLGSQLGTGNRGTLQTAVQVEIKETSSTGNTVIPISGPMTKLSSKPASVPDNIYAVPLSDAQATWAVNSAGGIVNGLSGLYQFSESFDCTQVYNGSGVTVTITSIEYMNYSTTYVSNNNGGLNAEAAIISGSSNNVLTIKTTS